MEFEGDSKTVLFVVVDSLRADIALPTLDRLAADGVDCTSFYTPGASTPSSMPGFVQSRSPLDHGGYGLELRPDYTTLAEQLAAAGVSCAGWHSNVYTSGQYGFDRGFDHYEDLGGGDDGSTPKTASWRTTARAVTDRLGVESVAERVFEQVKRYGLADPNPKVRASEAVDEIAAWLPSAPDGARRFGYAHLMDTHLPYLPPVEYRRRVDDAPTQPKRAYDLWQTLIGSPTELSTVDVTALRGLYEAEALYVDDQLDRLVTTLRDRGLWEETALVVTADHGELFRDRKVPFDVDLKHPDYLCHELTHTPLVVAGGSTPTSTVEALTSGIDVAPTITRLLGVDPAEEWQGTRIDAVEREYVVSALAHAYGDGTGARVEREATHVAVRDEAVAVLWWPERPHETEYYRREDGEERRVDPDDETAFDRAVERAVEHGDRYTSVSDHGQTGNDVSERLRNLGYVD